MIEWSYFYDRYSNLADSKLKSYIPLLKSIDSAEELINAVVDIDNKDIKSLLIRRAMSFNVVFTQSHFYSLANEIPTYLCVKLAREGNVKFGTNEEVAEVLASIFDENVNEALYRRALRSGVKFTQKQLEWIGKDKPEHKAAQASANSAIGSRLTLHRRSELFDNSAKSIIKRHVNRPGNSIFHITEKRHNGKCNGDCANCPPHYGYRYGRWYYGHGHQHGCERDGNGGAKGKCYRD